MAQGWLKVLQRFNTHFAFCKAAKVGCRWCMHSCCDLFQQNLGRLKQWRERMAAMSSEAQDVAICNIFHGPTCMIASSASRPSRPTEETTNQQRERRDKRNRYPHLTASSSDCETESTSRSLPSSSRRPATFVAPTGASAQQRIESTEGASGR